MTTPKPDDHLTPTDQRVAAAWRAASQEDPPAALDAAILAAARREAGAGPQGSRAREAMRARGRWWPLAAAATVAAIAVGLLQLTTPDQLGAPAPGKTTVTDMPAPAAGPAPGLAALAPRADAARDSAPVERASPAGAAAPPPAPTAAAPGPRKDAALPLATTPAPRPFPASPPDASAPVMTAERPPPPSSNAAGAAAPEQQRPSPRRETAASDASAERALPPAPEPGTAPSAAASRATSPVSARAPSPPDAATGVAQLATEGAVAQRKALAKLAAGTLGEDKTEEARTRERAPLPVAEWIALIRRLRTEGKTADAARELAAFRAAHADHERLLPADLRDWRPAEK